MASRFETLLETVDRYQDLAAENYDRIRKLAEELRQGLCDFMDAKDGVCVHLVPPTGPFEPKPYGDKAFSMPPRGFRQLGPVAFGLAVRVTKGTDWLRLTMECRKAGDVFTVRIAEGTEYQFELPLADHDPAPFYQHVYDHIQSWFATRIDSYQQGEYGSREIGFDFADAADADTA